MARGRSVAALASVGVTSFGMTTLVKVLEAQLRKFGIPNTLCRLLRGFWRRSSAVRGVFAICEYGLE